MRASALAVALSSIVSLLLVPAAMAKDETFGYSANEPIAGTMCYEGQTCTAWMSAGAPTAPVTGWVTEFTVDHSTAGGSGQKVRLLVLKGETKTVEQVSIEEPLSSTEKVQKFVFGAGEQIEIKRGDALALTVIPSGSEYPDKVIANSASGSTEECASGPSQAGEGITGCPGLGIYNATDAVSAHIVDAVERPWVWEYPAPTGLTATSAELHASIDPDDPAGHATVARFKYGTVSNNLVETSPEVAIPAGEGVSFEEELSQSIGGLRPNTTYYYRVEVDNYEAATNSGWEYGNEEFEEEPPYEAEKVQSFATPPAPKPEPALSAATSIGESSAILNGTVNPEGFATKWRFEYGTSTGYGSQSAEGEVGTAGEEVAEAVSASITGLSPNTLYHYRLVAEGPGGTQDSSDGTFTTAKGPAPAVSDFTITASSANAISGEFHVNPQGYSGNVVVQYGTTTAYGSTVGSTPFPAGEEQVVTFTMSGLAPSTTYHYRAVASNEWGTTYGPDQVVKTAAAAPSCKAPVLSDFKITGVTSYSIEDHFLIDPSGGASTYYAQFGPTSSYGQQTASLGPTAAGPGALGIEFALEGLAGEETYHFRIVASNACGTTYGPDQSATTPYSFEELVGLFGLVGSPSAAGAPVVPVSLAKPKVVIGKHFKCPPACRVEAKIFAAGKHGKKIKLGKAKFKVPKDKRKHKLVVRLSKKARKLFSKHHHLHLKIHYKISNGKKKSKPTTIVSALTLKAKHGGKHHKRH